MADDEGIIFIMIIDEIPECSNPYCDNEAIGLVDHPVMGVVAVCGECLDMINRVSNDLGEDMASVVESSAQRIKAGTDPVEAVRAAKREIRSTHAGMN